MNSGCAGRGLPFSPGRAFALPAVLRSFGSTQRISRLVAHSGRQDFHQLGQHLASRPVLVVAFDECPWRGGGAGLYQHLFHCFFVGCPFLAIAPVFLGQLPRFVADGFALLEAAKLFLVRDVDPELRQDGSKVAQLPFEGVDLLVGALPFRFAGESFHSLHQHATIPGAIKNGDLSALRQSSPEAIQVMPGSVFALRRADGINDVAAGIKLFGDALDRTALARSIPTFEGDDDRALLQVNLISQLAQLDLAAGHFADVRLAVQGTGKIHPLQHQSPPPLKVSMAARNSASLEDSAETSLRGGALGPSFFSTALMMVSNTFFRVYDFEVASTIVQGAYSDSVSSSISSVAARYSPYFLCRAQSSLVTRHASSGSDASPSKRRRCSFRLICRKNFRITVPSSANMRSKSRMSR